MSNIEDWLNTNLNGWSALNPNEKEAIRNFAVLWPYFELNSTGRYGRPNATPANIIKAVDDLVSEPDTGRLEEIRQHFSNRYIQGTGYTAKWDHLRMDTQYFNITRRGLVGEGRTGSDVLKALLLIANRLRNNSFHGEKAAYRFNGQYSNFRHANLLLMYALEVWPTR